MPLLEYLGHHAVGFSLMEIVLLINGNDACGILTSVLQHLK